MQISPFLFLNFLSSIFGFEAAKKPNLSQKFGSFISLIFGLLELFVFVADALPLSDLASTLKVVFYSLCLLDPLFYKIASID